ncbi:hypothetical protein V1478_000325 [Vespula squamosa]|uniref:Uncharacterized protein n=1 Tax=Vespula squamosa TaxID=30214 RepID=A0ABD2C560_VESSQ
MPYARLQLCTGWTEKRKEGEREIFVVIVVVVGGGRRTLRDPGPVFDRVATPDAGPDAGVCETLRTSLAVPPEALFTRLSRFPAPSRLSPPSPRHHFPSTPPTHSSTCDQHH